VNSSGRAARMADLLIHVNAAYTFARWLLADPTEAEDAVVEACGRAFRGETRSCGADVLARFLMLVRKECHARLGRNGNPGQLNPVQDGMGKQAAGSAITIPAVNLDARTAALKDALLHLPLELREVIVLLELHELPYKDISTIIGIPAHTVMSRLSRVRVMLMRSPFPDAERAVPLGPYQVGGDI
jgi:RNA polymerase sigma-70 factor (ECF subfamily)